MLKKRSFFVVFFYFMHSPLCRFDPFFLSCSLLGTIAVVRCTKYLWFVCLYPKNKFEKKEKKNNPSFFLSFSSLILSFPEGSFCYARPPTTTTPHVFFFIFFYFSIPKKLFLPPFFFFTCTVPSIFFFSNGNVFKRVYIVVSLVVMICVFLAHINSEFICFFVFVLMLINHSLIVLHNGKA